MDKYLEIIRIINSFSDLNSIHLSSLITLTPPSAESELSDWTEIPVSSGARFVYVSTSGSDLNDGLSEATAKYTFSSAYSLIRNYTADWLLFKRGDVFTSSNMGTSPFLSKGGPSSTTGYYSVVSSFGDVSAPRPLFMVNGNNSFFILSPGFASPDYMYNLAIFDLHIKGANLSGNNYSAASSYTSQTAFYALHVSPPSTIPDGISFKNLIFENNKIERIGGLGIIADQLCASALYRRNIFVDINETGIFPGFYNPSCIDNIFIRTGRSPYVSGTTNTAFSQFVHSAYVNGFAGDKIVCSGNIIIKCLETLMNRGAGYTHNNVGIQNFNVGVVGQSFGVPTNPNGLFNSLKNCLYINSLSGDMFVGNTSSGEFINNMFLNTLDSSAFTSYRAGVSFFGSDANGNIGVRDSIISGNIFTKDSPYNTTYSPPSITGLTFYSNVSSLPLSSVPSIESYLTEVGIPGSSLVDYEIFLESMDKSTYNSKYKATTIYNYYLSSIT